jgi:hypothetical protein
MLDCSHLVGDTESVRQVRNGKSASRQPSSEWRVIHSLSGNNRVIER